MSNPERLHAVAPCGIDCGICELYLCKDNQQLIDYLVSKGVPKEKLPCAGCQEIKGFCPVIGGQCTTYACVMEKNVDFCFECCDFPCSKLHPSADRAGTLPHNLKVFNLCTIRREGVEGFIALSDEIKKKYFKGKMEIGKGPKLED
jgi:hypothetical protein